MAAWTWPLDLGQYDRSSALTAIEEDQLTRYAEAYRFYRYGRTMDFGRSLDRLVQPLNDASRLYRHHHQAPQVCPAVLSS